MAQNMVIPNIPVSYVDKRKLALSAGTGPDSRLTAGTIFTANAGGSTTTLVGANAAPGTNDVNTIRRGEKFKLFNSSGVAKEETVFRVTNIGVAASTTVTFIPAAAVATVSGDVAKRIGPDGMDDISDLDFTLNNLDSTTFTQAKLDQMTINDKIYALRAATSAPDAGSLP